MGSWLAGIHPHEVGQWFTQVSGRKSSVQISWAWEIWSIFRRLVGNRLTLSPDSRDRGVINTSAIPRDPVWRRIPPPPPPPQKKKKRLHRETWEQSTKNKYWGQTAKWSVKERRLLRRVRRSSLKGCWENKKTGITQIKEEEFKNGWGTVWEM